MANSKAKQRKKRMKKQLVKRIKEVNRMEVAPVKKVTPAEQFQESLNKLYKGAVTPVTRYTNQHATMLFHCDKCGAEFYNKAGYMIGKDHQKHICTMPYGDSFGTRLATVGKGKTAPQKRKKQLNPDKVLKLLNEMIVEDYTYQEIAKELQVNPNIIKDHFIKEGLI